MAASLFRQSMEKETIISIDLGGTKILGALIDRSAQIAVRMQRPSPQGNDLVREAVIGLALDLALCAREQELPLSGIAICAPGFIDTSSGTMLESDNLLVKDLPLAEALTDRLRLPARLFHDVQAAALGEAVFGRGIGFRDFIYLNIGTGVSVGLYLDGKIRHGAFGKAGELGNFALGPAGSDQPCAFESRLEQQASGPALVRRALRQIDRQPASLIFTLAEHDPKRVTTRVIQEAAHRHDALALQLLAETADLVGFVIGGLQDVLDLECIILGGGIARLGDLVLVPLERSIQRYANTSVPVLLSTLGSNSGVIGAAAALFEQGET